jgi:hypothetical protein
MKLGPGLMAPSRKTPRMEARIASSCMSLSSL